MSRGAGPLAPVLEECVQLWRHQTGVVDVTRPGASLQSFGQMMRNAIYIGRIESLRVRRVYPWGFRPARHRADVLPSTGDSKRSRPGRRMGVRNHPRTHVVVASGTGARLVPAPELAAFAEGEFEAAPKVDLFGLDAHRVTTREARRLGGSATRVSRESTSPPVRPGPT